MKEVGPHTSELTQKATAGDVKRIAETSRGSFLVFEG